MTLVRSAPKRPLSALPTLRHPQPIGVKLLQDSSKPFVGRGLRLLVLRKVLGLSQEQLANDIGTSRQTISEWERNVVDPSMGQLRKLVLLFPDYDEVWRWVEFGGRLPKSLSQHEG